MTFFSGKALSLYQDIRKQVHSWEELVAEFKLELMKVNHDEDLLIEIKRRTQAKEESIGIYLAIMNNYFNRLTQPILEKEKLAILLRNIRPFFQKVIGLQSVNSISELRTICRRLEAKNENIEYFREPPPRRPTTMEPGLAYMAEDLAEGVNTMDLARPQAASRTGVKCWRCHKLGHKARNCTAAVGKYCFKCKKEGYTVRTCPDCSPSGNGQRRS